MISASGSVLFRCTLLLIDARAIKALSDHGELVSVLTGLYTLLETLAAITDNVILLPPSDAGIRPANISDDIAASQAGFSEEAVHALSAIAYLEDSTDTGSSKMFLTKY